MSSHWFETPLIQTNGTLIGAWREKEREREIERESMGGITCKGVKAGKSARLHTVSIGIL